MHRKLVLDVADGELQLFGCRHKVLGREDVDGRDGLVDFAGQRIELADAFDLVAPQLDADGGLGIGGHDVERVATHPERAAVEVDVVALELQIQQLAEQFVTVAHFADADGEHDLAIVDGAAQTKDARYRRHNQHIAAGQQGLGGGVAQTVDFFVDRRFFFDVQIFAGHIRLGGVRVVVRNEHLDRSIGEQIAELCIQLRHQGFVVGQYQRGSLQLAENPAHDGGFARPRGTQQRLIAQPVAHTAHELLDGLGLVASGFVGGVDRECHAVLLVYRSIIATPARR